MYFLSSFKAHLCPITAFMVTLVIQSYIITYPDNHISTPALVLIFMMSVHWQLLHSLVDGICKRGHLHYQDYDQTWTLEEWFDLVDASERVVKAAIREPLNKDQVKRE